MSPPASSEVSTELSSDRFRVGAFVKMRDALAVKTRRKDK